MAYQAPTENYYAKNPRMQGGMTATGAQNGPYASPPFIPASRGGGTAATPGSGYQTTAPANQPMPPGGGANGWEMINGQWGHNLPGGATALPQPQAATPAVSGNQGSIQTNITPQSIYTPDMTHWAVNQAVAENTPDLRLAMKQFDRPGVSHSAGTVAAAMPTVAASQLAQRNAAAQIPLLDEIANQKNLLSGETAREQQALEMGGLLNRLNQTRQQQQLTNMQQGSSLLQALLG